jgi:hypothetical protein
MACTWVAPLSVTTRPDAIRLTTTRSALRPSAQSDPPAAVTAAAVGALDELALAEAGCPALPAETLPHAASPIRAVTAIRPCTPRTAIAGLLSSPWTVPGRPRFRPDSTLLLTGGNDGASVRMSYEACAGSPPPRYASLAAEARKLDDSVLALSY